MKEARLSLAIFSAISLQHFWEKFWGVVIGIIGVGLFAYGLAFGTTDVVIGVDGIALSFAFMLAGIAVFVLALAFFWKV